jgi:hypothetical protein
VVKAVLDRSKAGLKETALEQTKNKLNLTLYPHRKFKFFVTRVLHCSLT